MNNTSTSNPKKPTEFPKAQEENCTTKCCSKCDKKYNCQEMCLYLKRKLTV